jgi:hypothetical protein
MFNKLLYRGYFIFDLVAVMPGLITYENFIVYPCKFARFVRTNRLFNLLNLVFDKCLFTRYNKSKIKDIVDFVSLLIFVLFGTHLLACMWCYLGLRDQYLPEEKRESWAYVNSFDPKNIG